MSFLQTIRAPLMGGLIVALSMPAAYAGGAAGLARLSLPKAAKMREGGNALAPFAFIRLCVQKPQVCRGGGGVEAVEWSPQSKALIQSVNLRVNRSIRPVNDVGDTWSSDVRSGDCEDFALTKRHALVAAGLPASALRMAVARTASGEGHAVLVVKTSDGDFVLDNRSNRIALWSQTDLTFLKIASGENPRLWLTLL